MHTWTRRPLTRPVLFSLTLCTVGLAGVIEAHRLGGMTERIAELEERLAEEPRRRVRLEVHLETVQQELETVRGELERAAQAEAAAETLARRLAGAETRLVDIAGAIEAQGTSLAVLSEASTTLAPTLEERIQGQAREMIELWQRLRDRVELAESLAEESRERVQDVASLTATRDVVRMWNELVGPTVQLSGDDSVGSGVLLTSRLAADGRRYDTYVLTAWHVVRDIVDGDLSVPIPVTLYTPDGPAAPERAKLLAHDAVIDCALLRLERDEPVAYAAALAPRSRLSTARIFDEIYAVGCPLGNDPIPTPGEIATRHHLVDGLNYWMINAPTYIGNSGGGIFDAETHQLLGIFSKIYTHGALRPTIVPHMGLVTPLSAVFDWLEGVGYASLVPAEALAKAD